LALLPDFAEEYWPSMDLCAEMLQQRLPGAERDCPVFRRRCSVLPWLGRRQGAINADRFLNRHWDYPRALRRCERSYDAFHICDHSYAHLALRLPAKRTGVFCHDLDAFRALLQPALEPRPFWFRWMMRRVLRGLQQAAIVFHTTQAVKDAILRYDMLPAERLVHAPLGHAPEFTAEPLPDPTAERMLAHLVGKPYLLHVGSCMPRKRVEFLLELFAALRPRLPELRLVKVGGAWTPAQADILRRYQLRPHLIHASDISRRTLAVLYRRAAVVVLPSEAEGFGLPVIEALACGAPVLASDLPVLREVGGEAASYAPVDDLSRWREQVLRILDAPPTLRPVRLARASLFSWDQHARTIASAYEKMLA
jgi:glycosyltransferase involved in cell wall biosynthesis